MDALYVALAWPGLARSGGSALRDLWQLDSAFRKPTHWNYIHRNGRKREARRERKRAKRKGPNDVIETETLGECVTNGLRRLDPQCRIRSCAIPLDTIFDAFLATLYDKSILTYTSRLFNLSSCNRHDHNILQRIEYMY